MVYAVGAGGILTIDLAALIENWRLVGRTVAPAATGAVVKADAYGLGAKAVARALAQAGCRHFFVAHLCEAVDLREPLPAACSLYVLNGLMPGAEAQCAQAAAVPVLNSLDQIDRWAAHAANLGRKLPAILQLDSGMSRMGLSPEELAELSASRQRLEGIELRYIASHFACADEPSNPANAAQIARFEQMSATFPEVPWTFDNSGGALGGRSGHFDLVRPGIALYGANPLTNGPNPMRPVVQLEARIVQLRRIPAGAGVGYGLTFTAGRETRIATVSIGYADGWPCHLGNRGAAYIGGVRAPIAGRVSMDSLTLDVTDVPEAHLFPGAPVEMIGPHQTLEDVAKDAGTISYEILTRLGRRYARRYLGG